MGVLSEVTGGRRYTLGARCLIGRHPRCDLRVDETWVSHEHAVLHWGMDRWELRDLASRNGTFVEGKRLPVGATVPLEEGASFSLGRVTTRFVLINGAPPGVGARSRAGVFRAAEDRVLILPNDEWPEVSIFEDDKGEWVIESEEGTRAASDHEVVIAGQEAWVLELPIASIETAQAEHRGAALETIALRVGVSLDEEYVEVTLTHDGGETRLPACSQHYLLATLARARLRDAASPAAERGWLDREELCRMLATDRNKLNVDIFRLRQQIAAAGVHGAGGIVACRRGTGQIRLGVERVTVDAL